MDIPRELLLHWVQRGLSEISMGESDGCSIVSMLGIVPGGAMTLNGLKIEIVRSAAAAQVGESPSPAPQIDAEPVIAVDASQPPARGRPALRLV